jgi:hypothetical protein
MHSIVCRVKIVITNDDNYYVPTFVEQMLRNCSDTIGMVYCDTVHSYQFHDVTKSYLTEGSIDMGAFIVKYDIARHVRFKHEHFSADGTFADECRTHCAAKGFNIVQVPRPLFVHN